jgi:hypothetical protein
MLDNYSELIEQLITAFIKIQATELEVDEANIRLVLKNKNGVLVALLYRDAKFVRLVEIKEIMDLMG